MHLNIWWLFIQIIYFSLIELQNYVLSFCFVIFSNDKDNHGTLNSTNKAQQKFEIRKESKGIRPHISNESAPGSTENRPKWSQFWIQLNIKLGVKMILTWLMPWCMETLPKNLTRYSQRKIADLKFSNNSRIFWQFFQNAVFWVYNENLNRKWYFLQFFIKLFSIFFIRRKITFT